MECIAGMKTCRVADRWAMFHDPVENSLQDADTRDILHNRIIAIECQPLKTIQRHLYYNVLALCFFALEKQSLLLKTS